MAYWGEALSHTEPLWQGQDLEAGGAALRRPSVAPRTERERLHLDAVKALYGGGDYRARMLAYEESMRRLVSRFPDDLDAAALYSLAILATSFTGRTFQTYMRAAAVAEEVYARSLQHPGALHYLIHSSVEAVAPGSRGVREEIKLILAEFGRQPQQERCEAVCLIHRRRQAAQPPAAFARVQSAVGPTPKLNRPRAPMELPP